jgi:hypothetical protein
MRWNINLFFKRLEPPRYPSSYCNLRLDKAVLLEITDIRLQSLQRVDMLMFLDIKRNKMKFKSLLMPFLLVMPNLLIALKPLPMPKKLSRA